MEVSRLAQIVLLTLMYLLANSAGKSYEASPGVLNKVTAEDYHGSNLFIGYMRNNEKFFLDKTLKASRLEDSISERFNISETPTTIQTIDGNYVGISEDNGSFTLLATPYEVEVPFELISTTNESYFTISYEKESLVTLNSRPPFTFYLQQYFPDEPPAIFFVDFVERNVTEVYAGNRSNTAATINFIRTTEDIDKAQGYTELLGVMEELGHATSGREIFGVGYYIKEDLSTSSQVFKLLPTAVQYILHEDLVSLEVDGYPLEGHVVPVLFERLIPFPYKFTFEPSYWWWTIEFSQEYPCYFDYPNSLNCDTNSMHYFDLSLTSSRSFEIFFNDGTYLYRNNRFFLSTSSEPSAEFTPSPYVLDVRDMYASERGNIPSVALAIHKFSDQKSVHYQELYSLMMSRNEVVGPEIFSVARLIFKDLGQDSSLFKSLPPTVQTLFVEKDLAWAFNQTETGVLFPMKYHLASDVHTNIQPFHFRFNESSLAPVAISYSDTHHLLINSEDQLDILASFDPTTASPLFLLHLASDYTQIEIELQYRTTQQQRFIRTANTSPEFYFFPGYGSGSDERAQFTISKF